MYKKKIYMHNKWTKPFVHLLYIKNNFKHKHLSAKVENLISSILELLA